MKKIALILGLFTSSFVFSQSLPFDFEGDITTSDFVDFDGGVATVLANPSATGINTSATVAQIVRDGGDIFGGSKIILDDNLDFSVNTVLSMKVYTTAPVGTIVKFKLESANGFAEVDMPTTVSGEWETIEWVFAGTPNTLNEVVFMFDFGNVGDGSEASTFYFDDVEQIAGPPAPIPATLPIDFEGDVVSSDFLNYAGAVAAVIPNPEVGGINTSNTVCEVVKDGGQFWAGSKLLLADNLDLSTSWVMSMKVFTSAPVGTRIKMELQGPEGLYNLDYLTTVSGEWEIATWNFDGQTLPFNEINLSFDFGNVGDGSATSTFLFDDWELVVGPAIPDPVATTFPVDFEESVVTSDFTNEFGAVTDVIANPFVTDENPSATVGRFVRSGGAPWAQSRLNLTGFIDFSTLTSISMKVYTDAPVGTLLKFKVQAPNNEFANERDVFTTVSGEWATYYWDFAGDPPVYNVLTLMLGYSTPNDASPTATFYFDDIQQSGPNSLFEFSKLDGVRSYPNPAKNQVTISSDSEQINTIILFDIQGREVLALQPNNQNVSMDVSALPSGLYVAQISTVSKVGALKLMVE
ncbi:T9SS type A sorting domain-containing protein [Cryomorphaceae bacterium 1068]|nr:T9SS type A sorting domain-containing protein [Cryomorphaceae bacterium 1068]